MSSLFKILVALSFFAFTSPAFAQATRTWVSGVGDDVNPCSRTAPCKTFAGAISKTAANGEINCLDPGGFGAVTITKSITIDCTGTIGSILNSGTNGINVNDSATGTPGTIDVILRGLAFDGGGPSTGINGIRFSSGRSLYLQDVFIQNENGGNGIAMQPAGAAELYAEDVTVTDSDTGILLQPSGTGSVRAVLRNVRSENNNIAGLVVSGLTATSAAGTVADVEKSAFTGSGKGIIANAPGTSPVTVMVNDSVISANTAVGLESKGSANSKVRVANTTITSNGTGLSIANGATINSYGNNRLDGNTANGTFTAPVIPQQ